MDAPIVFTPREREVLAHLAEGKSNRQIGEAICRSPKTVDVHRCSIYRKLLAVYPLGVNAVLAARYAWEHPEAIQ